MQSLAKMGMVAVICLGATVGAGAGGGPRPLPPGAKGPKAGVNSSRPVAGMKLPQAALCFRVIPSRGPRLLQAKTSTRVLANHPFRLVASFAGLSKMRGRAVIPPQQMMMTINGRSVPIGTERVVIASGDPTPGDGVDVPIVVELTLKGSAFFPAGQYGGNLELWVM